jgi:molybdate transport system substrate-binding protein
MPLTPFLIALCGWFRRWCASVAMLPALLLVLPLQAQTLNVGVDTPLAAVLAEAVPAFTATRPGVKIVLKAAPAAALLDELARGAPLDLLVGIERETAALGEQRRLLRPEARAAFASNRLVLVVPAGVATVQRLADLALPAVQRVGLGRSGSLPLGRHGREALNAQRLWPAVQRKVVQADDSTALLALVKDGAVDAALVYETDALAAGAALRMVQVLPTPEPLRHGAHVSSASRQAELATAFAAWLRGDAARALLQARGFGPP